MAEETENVILSQPEGARLALDHEGGLALYGAKEEPALQHQFAGQVVHATPKPLVHMVYWGEEDACRVDLTARVTVAGDPQAPVEVHMAHRFENEHQQHLTIDPLNHSLKVDTALAQPIHHALQIRTPLQVRFCNVWDVASDYTVEVNLGEARLLSIRLTGKTTARPEPCEPECDDPPSVGVRVTPSNLVQ
jgi:hypothetical protein